jgi:hypothetical protein
MIRVIKYYLSVLWSMIERFMSSQKIKKLKDLLATQKKESEDARDEADDDYDDFMRQYDVYTKARESELRRAFKEVRGDGEVSEKGSGEAGRGDSDSGEGNS